MKSRIHTLLIILLFLTPAFAGIVLVTPDAQAFKFYSDLINAPANDGRGDGTRGNCADCHNSFKNNNNYVSQAEGVAWGQSLHNSHKNSLTISDACGNCHDGNDTARRAVNIGSSNLAADGVNAIGCTGCHEPSGLRAHHAANGITLCAGCHPNDPTPPTEDIAPPWYVSVQNHYVMPPTNLDPCNAAGQENFAGAPTGLDNDGDNAYDTADPDCACQPTGAPETLCNGLDDDCDGQIDEDFMSTPTSCGDGVCASTGQTTCVGGAQGDTCSPGPQNESSDVTCDGVDGDCDGQIDEDYMIDATCGLGVCGPPNNTPSSCFDGVETACQPGPAAEPGTEMTCIDGLDNDCDGVFDDATTNPVNPDPDCTGCTDLDGDGFSPDGGACGPIDCNDGDNTIYPGAAETACNGIDNDCDLAVDEDYSPVSTICGEGACASTGATVCIDGVVDDTCTPGTPAADDATCDGVDNDCNGQVDEDYVPMPTTCGAGACASNGATVCIDGVVDDTCAPGTPGADDATCDGLDDDCDGMIDEDFVAQTTDCGNGPCASTGVTECVAGVENDTCTPLPAAEPDTELTCDDMIDNDCDGLTDAAQDPDCGASLIPPPVKQNIGFNDTVESTLTAEECRFCHEDPDIVDDAHIPNRHHNLVNTEVAAVTVRPYPDGDTNGNYDCFSCHELVWDPDTQSSQLSIFRDCLECHNLGSPHHMENNAQALAQNCAYCHGPVDNPFDGHQIPSTTPSLVTPEPSGGLGLPLNSRGNGAGACNYCHDSGLTMAGFVADTNMDLHHIAFGPGTSVPDTCVWCHKNGDPYNTDPDRIRTCERCHGFESLHNIQLDSDAAGLVDTDGDGAGDTENFGNILPNFENPYWGHIGNNDDCWGCHGFSQASAPGTGALIPQVDLLSQYSVIAGADSTLTLTGAALTNTVQTPEGPFALDSKVVLTAKDGTTTTLLTTAISESRMEVVVPSSLAAGNYKLHAVKGSQDSNAVGFSVIPGVIITGADCDKQRNILTIAGSGFGTKPEGTDADISVEVNGGVYGSSSLISWSDTQIRVSVGSCSNNPAVTVNALFGSATLESGNDKPPKPCRKNC